MKAIIASPTNAVNYPMMLIKPSVGVVNGRSIEAAEAALTMLAPLFNLSRHTTRPWLHSITHDGPKDVCLSV